MTNSTIRLFIFLAVLFAFPGIAWSQEVANSAEEPTLVKAAMCESIEKFAPVNEAVVFSSDLERIFCFTRFDPVPIRAIIYHKWYHRGILISAKQFTVNPPRWSSSSSMQLRDADKGAWHVEITDKSGKLLSTLRFSITD